MIVSELAESYPTSQEAQYVTECVMRFVRQIESREQMIARWEKEGRLDPTCKSCREFYDSPRMPSEVFAPRHEPSERCQSGKRAHCTCDTCF